VFPRSALLLCWCGFSVALIACSSDDTDFPLSQGGSTGAAGASAGGVGGSAASGGYGGQGGLAAGGGGGGAEPTVQQLVDAVSATEITATVADLSVPQNVGINSRYTRSSSFPIATNYLKGRCEALGLITDVRSWTNGGVTSDNVLCEVPAANSNAVLLIGAHYDSIAQPLGPPPEYVPAPGATDNASGTAAALEIARVMSSLQPSVTLRFAFFAGEELGLLGSAAYVDQLSSAGELIDIELMLDMDQVGRINQAGGNDACTDPPAQTGPGNLGVCLESVSAYASILDEVQSAGQSYTGLFFRRNLSPYGSDHIPFLNAAVPSLLTIEAYDENNAVTHSAADTLSALDVELTAEVTRMNVAVLGLRLGLAP